MKWALSTRISTYSLDFLALRLFAAAGSTATAACYRKGSFVGSTRTGVTRKTESITAVGMALLVMATLSACTSTESPDRTTPESEETSTPAGSVAQAEPVVALASSDLAVGPNRFAFGVLDANGTPVRTSSATATFVYLGTETQEVRAQVQADFVQWPEGRAGIYVANVSLDESGRWGVIVQVVDEEANVMVANTGFAVAEQSASPAIGDLAPKSTNKTVGDSSDLSDITSSREPDPELYGSTISEAAASGRPTVVTFATPAFCRTATCGPQVEVVGALKDRYEPKANFIHVEVFDNPKEMIGNFDLGRISPIMDEWGLATEPWTFVLDREGRIASKFEAFVTEEELESALQAILGS